MSKYSRLYGMILLMSCVISVSGCSYLNKNYGNFVVDEKAKIAFETSQINPEYNYYISSGDLYPVAILGLDKSYTMGNDLWKEKTFTKESLGMTVTNMQNKLMERCSQKEFGFAVLTPQGKQIGILYTYLGLGVAIEVHDNNVIKMHAPREDDQLKQYRARTWN